MGELPSQQPPDWWNMSGPCSARRRRSNSAACTVTATRLTFPMGRSEESELAWRVTDQQVLGLLVVLEHHLVVLAADAGLLVPAEGRVRGVEVVAVCPDPAGLDGAPQVVGGVHVPGPDASAQPVQGVVGDLHGVVQV